MSNLTTVSPASTQSQATPKVQGFPTREACAKAPIESVLIHVRFDQHRARFGNYLYGFHSSDYHRRGWDPPIYVLMPNGTRGVLDPPIKQPLCSKTNQGVFRQAVFAANGAVLKMLEPFAAKTVRSGIAIMKETHEAALSTAKILNRWSAVSLVTGLAFGSTAAVSFMAGKTPVQTVVSLGAFLIAGAASAILCKASRHEEKMADAASKSKDVLELWIDSNGFQPMPKTTEIEFRDTLQEKAKKVSQQDTIRAKDTDVESGRTTPKVDWDPNKEFRGKPKSAS